MATFPGLVIKIGANTQDAIAGLNKVNRALGSSASRGDRLRASMKKVAPALGLAAAAAGVLAVKMGTDAVRAAMEEEASVSKLNKALGNLGMSKASEQTSQFVDDLQFATGVADTELRPALSSLAVATGDMAEAQKALNIALDISAQTSKPLSAVVAALSKGYLGNTQGLLRLNAGVEKNILATGDMNKINAEFARITGGAAATAAGTLQGRMNILRIGVDELQESFGKGLIDGFMDTLSGGTDDVKVMSDSLREMQGNAESLGDTFGTIVATGLKGFGLLKQVTTAMTVQVYDLLEGYQRLEINVADFFGEITDEEGEAARAALDMSYADRHAAAAADILGYSLDGTADSANDATGATARLTTASESNANSMDKQRTAAKKLKDSLDRLNNNRSIMQQKFDLAGLLQNGPGKSGQRKGADGKMTEFTTLRDRKEFAFTVADQYANLADSYKKPGRKRGALADAREAIRGMNLPAGFQSDLIDTLTPAARSRTRPGTPQTGREVAGVNYNFYGDIKVANGNAAKQAAKEAQRLAALSGSRYAGMAETGRGY